MICAGQANSPCFVALDWWFSLPPVPARTSPSRPNKSSQLDPTTQNFERFFRTSQNSTLFPKMPEAFTLEDRSKFVARMDRIFTDNIRLRKEMNKLILRSNNIVRTVKLEKKVSFLMLKYNTSSTSGTYRTLKDTHAYTTSVLYWYNSK